ncbi:transporter substrate-binding domain-containing protein [Celerinatantimonas sp. MCCC 1A17872]|uniref:transporter substrate-binding domain-containing protein n=1 Tax=Celerinatantimonas sp. MCCC 1A17872 TaxID=3177514 RepID=UPI0038C788C0
MAKSKWIIALSLACLSCSAAAAQQETFHVALDGTYAPMAMPKLGGGLQGFNVDLTHAIAKQMGVKIEITSSQFSGLIPAMQAGTYDFLVAPVTINKERAKHMLFAEGYLNTDYQFVTKKGAPAAKSLKDFAGKVVAVNKGSNYDQWARENAAKYHWKVASYGTTSDSMQALVSGRADAALTGNTTAAWAVKKSPMLALSYRYDTGAVWSMPFRKDEVKLRNRVERAVECLKINGTLVKLSQKWFGTTPAKGSAAITPLPGYGQPGFEGYVKDSHQFSCKK